MRIRNVRPEFFTDEDLADLAPEVRLLFVGLWCLADWEGRLEDRPRRIKRQLFPSDAFDIEAGLEDLVRIGSIVRYEVGGTRVVWIRNFRRYQIISKRERENASKLPACPGTIPAPYMDSTSTIPTPTDVGRRTQDVGLPPKPPRKRGSGRASRVVGGIPHPEPEPAKVHCGLCGYDVRAREDGTPDEHLCLDAETA